MRSRGSCYCCKLIEDKLHFVDAFEANLAIFQDCAHGAQLVGVGAAELDDGLQLVDSISGDAVCGELGVDIVKSDFVELVNGYGDIYNLVGLPNHLGDAAKNLAVVNLDAHTDAEAVEYLIDNLHQLHLVEQRVAAYHVSIALVELAVATLLRTVGAPHGLDLKAAEG